MKKSALSLFALGVLVGNLSIVPVVFAQDDMTPPSSDSPTTSAPASSPSDASPASGGYHHHHGEHHGGHMHHHHCNVMDQLNLSPDQKSKLKAMHEEFKSQNQGILADMHTKRQTLKQTTDPNQRQALHNQMREDWKQLHQQREANLKTILTPAQMSQYKSLKSQCKANYEKNGGHHHKDGGNS